MALLSPLAALIVALLMLPVARIIAERTGAIAHPRADRLAQRPIPTLGGLAIAAGIAVGIVLAPLAPIDRIALMAGLVAMVGLGLADDLGSVSPLVRLLLEAVTGAAFALAVTMAFDVPIRLAAVAVATVAVPVAINATNLVDNADGLAASLSLATALSLALLSIVSGNPEIGTLALVIAAACVAFLAFNLPPARVFMGDTGSLMLGFVLAATSILLTRDAILAPGDAHIAVAMVVPLTFALQIGDLAMVFVTRVRRGHSPFNGGVDHTSHRLIAAGLGPARMLLVLGTLAAGIGAALVAIAAFLGDFRLVAAIGLLLLGAVAAFEIAVAWRLPPAARPDPTALTTQIQDAVEVEERAPGTAPRPVARSPE